MKINSPIAATITNDQHGQAMLEFAGSIIILVCLLVALIDIGLRMADYSAVYKAARDGGRQAAITGNISDGINTANQTAWAWGLDPGKFSVTMTTSAYGGQNIITCNTRYTSAPLVRMFPSLTGNVAVGEKILTGKATFGWWDYEN